MNDRYTWIGFYSEFADALLEFKDGRQELLERIVSTYQRIGIKLPTLEHGKLPEDIDPFTVFGLFNKGITEDNRKLIIRVLAEELGVRADQPQEFAGIPVLNNLAATFYRFGEERGEHDIDHLWELFEAALALDADDSEATRSAFCAAFDRARAQKGIKWNLTMGLYWMRPHRFLNLDSRNRWYICEPDAMPSDIASTVGKLKGLPNGEDYLALCDRVRDVLAEGPYPYRTLPEFSNRAWDVSEEVNKRLAEWWPARDKYDPGITSERWAELIADDEVFGVVGRTILARMLDYGGAATCTQLAKKYGETTNYYNGGSQGLAKRVQKATGCQTVADDNENSRWWPILYVGRQAGKGEDGSYVWKLRPELEEAARAADLSGVDLYVKSTSSLGDDDTPTVHHWLYAPGEKASMWEEFYADGVMALGWDEIGDLSDYASKEEMRLALVEANGHETSQKNSAHAVWQFSRELKEGDVVYAKRGMQQIIGRGVVEGPYEYDPDNNPEYPNRRRVRWTHKGIWQTTEKFAMKTLTDVSDYTDFLAELASFFEDETTEPEPDEPAVEYKPYGRDDFLSEVYVDADAYDQLVGLLRAKRNVILQGAPGVGKTFLAKRLAYSVMGVKDPTRVTMVQFHQSYSYEDFVMGFRPSATGFELRKGAFYTFCREAADDLDNDYFFVIDEINRGNLSKIFGELFMLIEADKRGAKHKLRLLYSDELFHVPENVYIIGMMNTADRSLAMLDYALRRRFAFFDLRPGFSSEGFRAYQEGLHSDRLDRLVRSVVDLNGRIAEDESLGEGFCIGHSFLCNLTPEDVDNRLPAVVEYELIPLLREYWFDDADKVRDWSDRLRAAVK